MKPTRSHGQSMVEYLLMMGVIIAVILAWRGPLSDKMFNLMASVQGQLMGSGGTADSLLQ